MLLTRTLASIPPPLSKSLASGTLQHLASQHVHPAAATSRRPFAIRTMAGGMTAGKQLINTEDAPAAVGAYSQAVKAGETLYVSGQVGLIPGTKDLADGGAEGQAEQALKNMGAILKAAGADYKDVVKTTVLLADIADFGAVNTVYAKYFDEQKPARACYAAKALPLGAAVEIEAIAYVP